MKTTNADADYAAVALTLRDFGRDVYRVIKRPLFLIPLALLNIYAFLFALLAVSIEYFMNTFLAVSLLLTTFWLIPWAWRITLGVRFGETLRMLSPKAFRVMVITFLAFNLPIGFMLSLSPLDSAQKNCDLYSATWETCP